MELVCKEGITGFHGITFLHHHTGFQAWKIIGTERELAALLRS